MQHGFVQDKSKAFVALQIPKSESNGEGCTEEPPSQEIALHVFYLPQRIMFQVLHAVLGLKPYCGTLWCMPK